MIKGYPENLKSGFMCNHCGNDNLTPCTMTAYQCQSCMGVEFGPPAVAPAHQAREFAQWILNHFSEPEVRAKALALLGALRR